MKVAKKTLPQLINKFSYTYAPLKVTHVLATASLLNNNSTSFLAR